MCSCPAFAVLWSEQREQMRQETQVVAVLWSERREQMRPDTWVVAVLWSEWREQMRPETWVVAVLCSKRREQMRPETWVVAVLWSERREQMRPETWVVAMLWSDWRKQMRLETRVVSRLLYRICMYNNLKLRNYLPKCIVILFFYIELMPFLRCSNLDSIVMIEYLFNGSWVYIYICNCCNNFSFVWCSALESLVLTTATLNLCLISCYNTKISGYFSILCYAILTSKSSYQINLSVDCVFRNSEHFKLFPCFWKSPARRC